MVLSWRQRLFWHRRYTSQHFLPETLCHVWPGKRKVHENFYKVFEWNSTGFEKGNSLNSAGYNVSFFFSSALCSNPTPGCGADGDAVHPGGGGAGVGGAVGAEHARGHAAAVRPPVRRRRLPLRPQVRRHAAGAAGGGAAAVEPGALALPAPDRLRHRQDPLPLRLLRHGTMLLFPSSVRPLLARLHLLFSDVPC